MRTTSRNVVSAIIISKDRKILQGMKRADKGGVYADCWHIPGGGIDEGETMEQTLMREIKEETGIDISPYKIKLIDDLGSGESEKILKNGEKVLCKMKFYVYKVVLDDKLANQIDINLNGDLEKYEWVNVSELKNRKLTPPSSELFKKLGFIN